MKNLILPTLILFSESTIIMLSRDTDLSTSDLRTPLKFFSTTISKKGTNKHDHKERDKLITGAKTKVNSSINRSA